MSPSDTTEQGTIPERNKAAARAVFDVWSTGEIE
jgi:hypothetical protein